MAYEFQQIKEAYIKLKSYIYYDNSDLLLRRKLVEFETNKTKDGSFISFFRNQIPKPYLNGEFSQFFEDKKNVTVDDKLKIITDAINNYHLDSEFINYFLKKIDINGFPKKIIESHLDENFKSNNNVFEKYELEKVTPFIDAPIEIHIISVLWIIEIGIEYDKKLDDSCHGNRLLLNKEKTEIVKGSGLFKPYFKQYNKWRDDSVKTAQRLLSENKNAMFLSLDIRDYFHSVRIQVNEIYYEKERRHKSLQYFYNLKNIFSQINILYSEKVSKNLKYPYDFYNELIDSNNNVIKFVLPIGLASSYVLANHYLQDFDKRINQRIKPAYYGRYVDDILIVIADPNVEEYKDEIIQELNFNFKNYKRKHKAEVRFNESKMTFSQRFILANFYPILSLVNLPERILTKYEKFKNTKEQDLIIKVNGYESLFCQNEKIQINYFDYHESDLVIDKLKNELDERSSEFRDFPENEETEESFEDNAYHLLYDGTENSITTLKDYQENRYGLTVYLANKIFSALRHEKKETKEECIEVVKFFRGTNCLKFHTLWERIFTYLLVNNQASEYIEFYFHCIEEIQKINCKHIEVDSQTIIISLLEYLDCSHEISLALNPKFISKVEKVAKNFEFRINKLEKYSIFFWNQFKPTVSNSIWGMRFREANLIRHHYCIHPLLTYTKASKNKRIDLTSLNFDFANYVLDETLIKNSPRIIKFWECSLASAYEQLKNEKDNTSKEETDIFTLKTYNKVLEDNNFEIENNENISESKEVSYTEHAFNLYKKINENHLPFYVLIEDKELKEKYFQVKFEKIVDNLKIHELKITTLKKTSIPKIAFANTEVSLDNITQSIRSTPNLNLERYNKLSAILKSVRKEKADVLLFPENFIPVNILSSLVRFSTKNSMLTITGLEHITINKKCYNIIATILPVEVDGYNDSVIIFRLKNHYSHSEAEIIEQNHLIVPKPSSYRIDIFNWNNIYFSPFYCFELANVYHRSLLLGKIDLLIGIEWNKDTNYFSNIVEAGSRDIHAYVAQVNTSQFGDTRLTQPKETAIKDILRLKGGTNDSILIGEINIDEIREFQRKKHSILNTKGNFKPLPPDYPTELAIKRINNESIIK